MFNKPITRRFALVGLEIAFIGMLGWVVLSSGLPGQSSQANAPRQSKQKAQEQERSVPSEGIPEATSVKIAAAVGTPNACTGFDFEGGAVQGFTVTPVNGAPLWHLTNGLCRAFLAGHSTPFTFYYGQDATCNYNTGARNASDLISPNISLVGTFAPFSIGFNYLLFVESSGSFDTTFVDISTNNGTTWTPVLNKANLINDNQWHNVAVDVTAQVGAATSIKLRFRFDSVDNLVNSSTGWHVDDVVACGQPFNFCLQSDSGDNILQFNSITGKYLFKQCSTGFTREGTGTVTANGCNVSLQDNAFDHFVSVSVDNCAHTGTANLTFLIPPRRLQAFNIKDTNTLDNTCTCP